MPGNVVSLGELVEALDAWVKAVRPGEEVEWEEVETLWRFSHDLLTQSISQKAQCEQAVDTLTKCLENLPSWPSDLREQKQRKEAAQAVEWLQLVLR